MEQYILSGIADDMLLFIACMSFTFLHCAMNETCSWKINCWAQLYSIDLIILLWQVISVDCICLSLLGDASLQVLCRMSSVHDEHKIWPHIGWCQVKWSDHRCKGTKKPLDLAIIRVLKEVSHLEKKNQAQNLVNPNLVT